VKNIMFAIALICPIVTWAQDIKPFDAKLGLWESTSSTTVAGVAAMIPEEQLAQMPPAQRAQIEAMMNRGGGGSPRTTTVKYCLTSDSLKRALYNSDKNCTTKLVSSSANTQQIHLECTSGNTKTSGDFTIERVDAEHLKGSGELKAAADSSSAKAGRTMDIKMSMNNKWLSSDCGDVKPIGEK
jgi:hypothetical protein